MTIKISFDTHEELQEFTNINFLCKKDEIISDLRSEIKSLKSENDRLHAENRNHKANDEQISFLKRLFLANPKLCKNHLLEYYFKFTISPKINSVKFIRSLFGWDLKQSKDWFEDKKESSYDVSEGVDGAI